MIAIVGNFCSVLLLTAMPSTALTPSTPGTDCAAASGHRKTLAKLCFPSEGMRHDEVEIIVFWLPAKMFANLDGASNDLCGITRSAGRHPNVESVSRDAL